MTTATALGSKATGRAREVFVRAILWGPTVSRTFMIGNAKIWRILFPGSVDD
jgi:hypothetical protein